MKPKRITRKQLPTGLASKSGSVAPSPESAIAEAVPPELDCFAVPPEQVLLAIFPVLDRDPKALSAFAGLFSAIPEVDFGIPISDWAKRASAEFFKASGFPLGKTLTEWTPEELGKLIGLHETGPKEDYQKNVPPQFVKGLEAFAKHTKAAVNDASAIEARDFPEGRIQAAKVSDRMSNLSKRTLQMVWPQRSRWIHLVVSVAGFQLDRGAWIQSERERPAG